MIFVASYTVHHLPASFSSTVARTSPPRSHPTFRVVVRPPFSPFYASVPLDPKGLVNPTPCPWKARSTLRTGPRTRGSRSSSQHHDDHLAKLQSALLHMTALLQITPPGASIFAGVGLGGAEVLDESLFVRTAGLAAAESGGCADKALRLGPRRLVPHALSLLNSMWCARDEQLGYRERGEGTGGRLWWCGTGTALPSRTLRTITWADGGAAKAACEALVPSPRIRPEYEDAGLA